MFLRKLFSPIYNFHLVSEFPIRQRPTARLVVFDPLNCVLLICVNDQRPIHLDYPDLTDYWVLPGGGVEPGETYAQAAIRELREETGIEISELGAPIWFNQRKLIRQNGEILNLTEQIFLARVGSSFLRREETAMTDIELRWWTKEELQASADRFIPVWLAQKCVELI